MTPEQQALLQKAVRSLQAAKVLNKTSLPEFAAARGYYTMFYIASAFLEGEGLAFSRHSAVISAFGQRFANTGRVRTSRIPSLPHSRRTDSPPSRL